MMYVADLAFALLFDFGRWHRVQKQQSLITSLQTRCADFDEMGIGSSKRFKELDLGLVILCQSPQMITETPLNTLCEVAGSWRHKPVGSYSTYHRQSLICATALHLALRNSKRRGSRPWTFSCPCILQEPPGIAGTFILRHLPSLSPLGMNNRD